MRKLFIAGNWKMHGSMSQSEVLLTDIKQGIESLQSATDIDVVVLPTFVHLPLTQMLLGYSETISFGAQNLYLGEQGAFTGEVAGPMLQELGCRYVLIGHSERRTIFKEDLQLVAQKFQSALDAKLIPILCIGETREERETQQTESVLKQQLQSVIDAVGIDRFQNAIIAYEPVWAIGTGLTATPDQAQATHQFIRGLFKQNKVDIAQTIRILYGGSMKPDNAASLLSMPDIDGGLIGGASLNAASFVTICATAQKVFQGSSPVEMKG